MTISRRKWLFLNKNVHYLEDFYFKNMQFLSIVAVRWYTFLYHLYNVNKRCHPMMRWNVSMDGELPGTELLIQTPIIYVLISTKIILKYTSTEEELKLGCSPTWAKKQFIGPKVENIVVRLLTANVLLERAVGKDIKLGSFKLEKRFQLKDVQCINENLKSSFQHKTFQLNDLSNCSFQLHMHALFSPHKILKWRAFTKLPFFALV